MKKLVGVLLIMVLAAFSVAVVAAQGPVIHTVVAGGPDLCSALGQSPGCNANFALVAHQYADGSVRGQYDDRWEGGGFHAVVDCLSVSGNEAWISGIITQGDNVGARVTTRVRDNGTSANDPADQISYSWIGGASCTAQLNYPLLSVPQGQVNVR